MLRSSIPAASASAAAPSVGRKPAGAGAITPRRAPSCDRRRRAASAASCSSSTTPRLLPAAWPLRTTIASSRRAATSTFTTAAAEVEASTTDNNNIILPARAADQLPAVERALAAVATAAQASGAPPPRVAARIFETADGRGRVGLVATADAREGDVLLAVPESLAATAAGDAAENATVVEFLSRGGGGEGGGDDDAPAVGELLALALWLMAERSSNSTSSSSPLADALLSPLPQATLSPVLWPEPARGELLRGSPVLAEARAREQALREQWGGMIGGSAATTNNNPIAAQGEQAFLRAFCAVVATAAYLPSAGCFALVPVVSSAALRRSCSGRGASVDYDSAAGTAVLRCGPAGVRKGEEVTLEDGRPNGEFLLATGALPGEDVFVSQASGNNKASSPAAAAIAAARLDNPGDCLLFPASLLAADRLYAQKAEILTAAGLDPNGQAFPVRRDALPTQLLSYLRLARVQDPAQFARVSFDADVIVSQMNEYEVLQLLMGDCRERLAAYDGTLEEECKMLQGQAQEMMSKARSKGAGAAGGAADGDQEQQRLAIERLAARLRASEKAVLSATTDAVRRRLAPIRGIPTKSGGMQDPNADLREIFEALEGIPSAPARAIDTIRRWAAGEYDPEWRK